MSLRFTLPLFLCLAALTAVVNIVTDRYEPIGEELLANPDFRQGLSGWTGQSDQAKATTTEDCLLIENNNPAKSIGLNQILPVKQTEYPLLLQGAIRTENITPGKQEGNQARVLITGLDTNGKWLPGLRVAMQMNANTDWTRFSTIFHIPAGADTLLLRVELNHATGKLFTKDLSLHMAQESQWYALAKWPILCGWAFFLLVLARPYFLIPRRNLPLSLLVLGVGLLILAGAIVPGPDKEILARYLIVMIHDLGGFSAAHLPLDITKIGHFFGFLLLGLLSYLCFDQESPAKIFLDITLLAATSECLQFFAVERTPLFNDVMIDSLGGLLGIVIAAIIITLYFASTSIQADVR